MPQARIGAGELDNLKDGTEAESHSASMFRSTRNSRNPDHAMADT